MIAASVNMVRLFTTHLYLIACGGVGLIRPVRIAGTGGSVYCMGGTVSCLSCLDLGLWRMVFWYGLVLSFLRCLGLVYGLGWSTVRNDVDLYSLFSDVPV